MFFVLRLKTCSNFFGDFCNHPLSYLMVRSYKRIWVLAQTEIIATKDYIAERLTQYFVISQYAVQCRERIIKAYRSFSLIARKVQLMKKLMLISKKKSEAKLDYVKSS